MSAESVVRPACAADPEVVIRVDDVSKRYLMFDRPEHRLWQGLFRGRRRFYRDFWALRGVSFEVRRGETVGIIGPNGSGKSTLLQIVCGTLTPTSGSVQVMGRSAALLELGSGFNPEFTGRENVYLNGAILGLTRDQVHARLDDIAAFADIGRFLDQPVKTYSSGMTVRLAFSVVAHVDADVLVIDEALAVGDAMFTQKCMRFLRRFQERGTILFVSHDTGAVLNLCQRALWLREGMVAQAGPAKPVVQAYMRSALETVQGLEEAAAVSGAPAAEPATTSSDAAPSMAFGAGGARIVSVALHGTDGGRQSAVLGSERVTLKIVVEALRDVDSTIVGYHLKDRLGQIVFGDNTGLVTEGEPVSLRPGETAVAVFAFTMPNLRTGQYTLDVAVADGTVSHHVHQQWFFDVAAIEVMTDRAVAGLLAVHDADITLTRQALLRA